MVTFEHWWAPLGGVAACCALLALYLLWKATRPQVVFPPVVYLLGTRHLRSASRCAVLDLLFVVGCVLLGSVFFGRPTVVRSSEGDRAVIVALDTSLSMEGPAGASALAEGLRRAGEIIGALRPGDRANCVLVASTVRWAFPTAAVGRDRAALWQLLRQVRVQPTVAAFKEAIEESLRRLRSSSLPRRELYLISDFQASSWQSVTLRSESSVRIIPIQVGAGCVRNVAVRTPLALATLAGDPLRVAAQVQNYGEREERCRVKWILGEKVLHSSEVTCPPRSRLWTELSLQTNTPGVFEGRVVLQIDDDLKADNTARFSLTVLPQLRIALLASEQPLATLLREALTGGGQRKHLAVVSGHDVRRTRWDLFLAARASPSSLRYALAQGQSGIVFMGRGVSLPRIFKVPRAERGTFSLNARSERPAAWSIPPLTQVLCPQRWAPPAGGRVVLRFSDQRPAVVVTADPPVCLCLFDCDLSPHSVLRVPEAAPPFLAALLSEALSAARPGGVVGRAQRIVLPQRPYRFWAPDGTELFVRSTPLGPNALCEIPPVNCAGFVRVFHKGALVASLAVSVPESESDIRRTEKFSAQGSAAAPLLPSRNEVSGSVLGVLLGLLLGYLLCRYYTTRHAGSEL